ncbi:hypothetical protein [Paraburkholderia tropica]|uniref:hypothetical protein n=1 Tax=Paraburkholderia tropica TaxID=92647 RepID=UPI001CC74D50|nr:hypothetical protein [Paraburkholderia tropica]
MPVWLQVVLGLAAPLIAAAGVFVAFQQWLLGRRGLKHDLFDRRWAVYAATNDVIGAHLNGRSDDASTCLDTFLRRRMDAAFLLPECTNLFLGDVLNEVLKYRDARRVLSKTPADGPQRDAAEMGVAQAEHVLKGLHERLVEEFRSSLDLSK